MTLSKKHSDKDRPVVEKMEDRSASSEQDLEQAVGDSPKRAREREHYMSDLEGIVVRIGRLVDDARRDDQPDIARLAKELQRAIMGAGFGYFFERDKEKDECDEDDTPDGAPVTTSQDEDDEKDGLADAHEKAEARLETAHDKAEKKVAVKEAAAEKAEDKAEVAEEKASAGFGRSYDRKSDAEDS